MSHIMPASSGDTNPETGDQLYTVHDAAEILCNPMRAFRRAKDRVTLTALLEHDASGWIPELHDDDCDDDACTGCADEAPAIAHLDVPLAQLDADLQSLRLKREAAERERAGLLAEQRHQLLDLDADSVCPLEGACRYPYLTAGGQS